MNDEFENGNETAMLSREYADAWENYLLWNDLQNGEATAHEVGFRQGWFRRKRVDSHVILVVLVLFSFSGFLLGFVCGNLYRG